jgi:hypothetical protein
VDGGQERRVVSRTATARVLVLLASGFVVAGSLLVGLGVLFFGGPVLERHGLGGAAGLGAAVFGLFVLVGVVVANIVAVRGRSVGRVAGLGCGILLGGVVVGLALMLMLISQTI